MSQTRDVYAAGVQVTVRRHDEPDLAGQILYVDNHGVCVLRTFSRGETSRILVPWTEVREVVA